MISKKLLVAIITFSLGFGTSFSYDEISCETDPSFEANSCNQCFDGLSKDAGSNIGFLTDDWINASSEKMLLFKEEQDFPTMLNLNPENVEISSIPSSDDFWEYTDDFNALYSEEEEGYVLEVGDKVTWIKSKLGAAYSVDKNTAENGTNIAMLVFPITSRNVLSDGTITDANEHRECVLFKSGEQAKEVVTPPKKLPDAGAEHILLIIIALLLGFGIMKFRKKA